jgi:hypothetical protein
MNQSEGIYYDLPESVYRADEAVSQSLLKEFGESATPLHFKTRDPKEPTEDMEFGTVMHAAILTPELLHSVYYERPDTYPAEVKGKKVEKKWNGNADWCREWIEKHSDRIILTKDKAARIAPIRERVLQIPEFAAALEVGKTEVAHFRFSREFGLMLKCRVDLEATDSGGETWLFDLKKVQSGCAIERDFRKQAYNLGYDIQAASYLEITGANHFVFVVFDDDKPFDAIMWKPDSEFINHGKERWRSLLARYSACVREDKWPGYAPGFNVLSLPEFVKR